MARFQKGQSGNPNSRPTNEQRITPLLDQKRIARVLVGMAESGDLNAIKVVLDRVVGKAQERFDLTSDGQMFLHDHDPGR